MPKLDRYLTGDFLQSFLATLIVLLVVSLGGVLVDVLGNIADGGLPARLMLSQLGLQLLVYLPLVLPLALMLGLMLAVVRLYRDSEMAVLNAVGVGPRRLLRPLLWVTVPVVLEPPPPHFEWPLAPLREPAGSLAQQREQGPESARCLPARPRLRSSVRQESRYSLPARR